MGAKGEVNAEATEETGSNPSADIVFRDRLTVQIGSDLPYPGLLGIQLSSATTTTLPRSSLINILSDTFLQPLFGSRCRIAGGNRSSNNSSVKLSSMDTSPRTGSVMINSGPCPPRRTLAFDTCNPLTRRAIFLSVSIFQQFTDVPCGIR